MFEIVMLIAFAAAAFSQFLPERPDQPSASSDDGSAYHLSPGPDGNERKQHAQQPATRPPAGRHHLIRRPCRSRLQIRTSVLP